MKEKIYRVHYNWFTISDKGEFYFDFTLGEPYTIPGLYEKFDVEEISVEGTLISGNAVATVKLSGGITIQQNNICAIIVIPEDYGTEPDKKEDA